MMRTAQDLLLGVSRDPQAPLVNAYRVDGIHDPDSHQLSPDSHQLRATTPSRLVEQIALVGSRPRRDSMPDRGQQAGLAEMRHCMLLSNPASVAKCMFYNKFLFEWKPSP